MTVFHFESGSPTCGVKSGMLLAKWLLAITVFCLLVPNPLQAGTASQFTITKDAQALKIAQKALDAMGGAKALLSYQDSVATGTLTVHRGTDTDSYSITFKTKGTQ